MSRATRMNVFPAMRCTGDFDPVEAEYEIDHDPINQTILDALDHRHNTATARALVSVMPEVMALLVAQQTAIDMLQDIVDEEYDGDELLPQFQSGVRYILDYPEEELARVVEETFGAVEDGERAGKRPEGVALDTFDGRQELPKGPVK